MDIHDVANIFPMMSAEEYAALVEDIRANGQREPVWTYDNKIIDGRNRYKACQELGLTPTLREWNGNGSLVAFVVSLNLHRRHLSSSQRAVIGLEVETALREEAHKNMVAGGMAHVQGLQRIENPTVHAAARAAVLVGSNRQYISDAKRVAKKAPDVIPSVRNGKVNIPDARRIATLPELARLDILGRVEDGSLKTKDIQAEVRTTRRALPQPERQMPAFIPDGVRLEVAEAEALPLADETVDLIVTSPPYGLEKAYSDYTDPSEGWHYMMGIWLAEMFRVTKQGGRLALNVPFDTTDGGNRPTWPQACKAAIDAGWVYRWAVIWNKDNVSKSIGRGSVDSCAAPHVIARVEIVGVFYKGMWEKTGEAKSDLEHDEWLDWTNGLWSFNGETNAWEGHPAPFPVELPRRSIKLLSYPGETVLDPFVGSGTTALAASTLGRKVYGYDHSAHYIESARRRLAQSTGVPIENASAA